MKPCNKHWNSMRAAAEARGLTHLVKSGEENQKIVVDQLKRAQNEGLDKVKPEPGEFDPLMSMYWMVMNKGLEYGGLYMMSTNPNDPDGHYCPICECMNHGASEEYTPDKIELEWINGPADAAHQECVRLGLIKIS